MLCTRAAEIKGRTNVCARERQREGIARDEREREQNTATGLKNRVYCSGGSRDQNFRVLWIVLFECVTTHAHTQTHIHTGRPYNGPKTSHLL